MMMTGQQLLWAEQSSPENLDSIVWPRAASSAEVSPSGNPNSGLNSVKLIPRFSGPAQPSPTELLETLHQPCHGYMIYVIGWFEGVSRRLRYSHIGVLCGLVSVISMHDYCCFVFLHYQ
jgi:hypothetical protein